jgi:hypothetical protein
MKQEKYISGDEKRGYKVAKVNVPLPNMKLKLFIEGRENWLEEGILVPAKKNKRGRIIEEGSSSATQKQGGATYHQPYGRIPMPPPYYGSVPMQALGSGAAMPPPPPTYFPPTFVVPNEAFVAPYASMPQPQQSAAIIGAYMQRNEQDVERIRCHVNHWHEGTAGIAHQLGRLQLVPPHQFHGGAMQQYYEQGFNESQPTEQGQSDE